MKLFHAIEGVMLRLSGIPGLQFLGSFVAEHQAESNRRKQIFGKYTSYVRTIRGAADEASHLGHGHGEGHGHEESHGHGADHGPAAKKHAPAKGKKATDVDDSEDDYEDEDDDDFESYIL